MQGISLEIALDRLGNLLPLLVVAVVGTIILEVGVYLFFTKIVRSKYALPYTLIAPAAVALVCFTLYPFLYNIRLAFSDLRLKTISCYVSADDISTAPCSLGQAALNADVQTKIDAVAVREEPSETAPIAFTLDKDAEIRITSRSKTSNYVSENSAPNCGTPLVPGPGFSSYNECRNGPYAEWQLNYETQDQRFWWEVRTEDDRTGWIPNNLFFMTANAELYTESQGAGDVLAQLTEGSEVRLVSRESASWYQVQTPDGLTGWVNVKPTEINLYIPATDTPLFKAQDDESELVATLAADTENVRLLRSPDQTTLSWYEVATDDATAWVKSQINIVENYHAENDTPVYAEMQASSEQLGTLNADQVAPIRGSAIERWYEIDVIGLENAFTGWVNVQPSTVEGFAMPESRDIYADTNEESNVLGSVEANAIVASLDNRNIEGDIWYQINTDTGVVGWVKTEPSEIIDLVILPAEAVLYSASGGEAPVIFDTDNAESEQAPLPAGTQITEISNTEVTWYRVQLDDGQQAWVKEAPAEISETYFTASESPAYAAFGDTSTIVTTFPENTQLDVNSTQVETWYQLQTPDRVVGWTNIAPSETLKVFAAAEDLEIYSEPSRLAESLSSLEQGDRLTETASREVVWYEVRTAEGEVGWVNLQPKEEVTTRRDIVLYSLKYGWNNFKRVFVDTDPATGKILGQGRLLQTENSTFLRLMRTTLIWTVFNVFFHLTIGMVLALMLNTSGLKFKGIYRAIIILPWAVPQVIIALVWRGEFDYQFGFVNNLLGQIGIDPVNWKLTPTPALVAVTFVNIWLGIPFYMVTLLGGLQSIGGDYYEAASMDGANAFDRFRHITVPLIRPVAVPILTLDVIWTFNNFNVIYLITEGGPNESTNILVTALYNAAFGRNGQFQLGFAAAFSLVIFAVLFVFATLWVTQSGALKGVYDK